MVARLAKFDPSNIMYTRYVTVRRIGLENRKRLDTVVVVVVTVRLHVMQRTVLLSQFCLSVRCVYCDKTKQRTANILIPHETAITLVF